MVMKNLAVRFGIRWFVSSLGLLIATAVFPSHIRLVSDHQTWLVAVAAGFMLAMINMFIKPLLVFLSIPALLLTLGLFMLVVNGFLIMIVSWLYTPLVISSFVWAIVAGLIIGLVNLLVSRVLEDLK